MKYCNFALSSGGEFLDFSEKENHLAVLIRLLNDT